MKFLFLSVFFCMLGCSLVFSQGVIRGKISDKNGETLIGVTVSLKSNRSIGVVTDLDGNYSLKIQEPEAQTLIISYVGYQTIEFPVHPRNNEVIVKNFVLEPSSTVLGAVEIVAKAVKANDHYMEAFQKNSTATLNYVSSEMMKKTGDANVTAAVARVSGVSTHGSFITVRGIGDRYVKTTINGSRIPTLDPFTNNIKLDIIPASLVDNVIITKTASPDIPGDWAGAYLSVETKDYPERLVLNVETSFGYNNNTSYKNILATKTSSADWLGYDNGFREQSHSDFVTVVADPNIYQEFAALGLEDFYRSMGVTGEIPWNETYEKLGLIELGLLSKGQFNDANAYNDARQKYNNGPYKDQAYEIINAEAAKSGQSFSNNWNTLYKNAPLNFSQSFSIGNQTRLFEKPLGFIAGFRYGNSVLYDPNSVAQKALGEVRDGTAVPDYIIQQEVARYTNGWSALINLAYKYNSNNSIALLFMPNFTGVNNIRDGVDTTDNIYAYRLNKNQFYEERRQVNYQFKSEHYIPGPKLKIELNASYTRGKSSAPDFKNLVYFADNNLNYFIDAREADNVRRNYRYLDEDVLDTRLSAELPLGNKPDAVRKLKFGGAYQYNTRKFDQYNYMLYFNDGATNRVENNDLDKFFQAEKFGIGLNRFGEKAIELYYRESAEAANHTVGFSEIKAGFVMLDYTLIPALRFSGGLRLEQTYLLTDVFQYHKLGYTITDPRRESVTGVITRPGKMNELHFLPSANLIFKLKKDEAAPVNLRLNYSQTVARPSLREYSETLIWDYELRTYVVGNPELKMVQVKNYDLRLESYFKSGDNVSLSAFYKDFKNHIEMIGSNALFTWENSNKSTVAGLELEGKKIISKHFQLRANITLANSQAKVVRRYLLIVNGVRTYRPVDTLSRTMFGQAPYVINTILTYTADSIGLTLTAGYNVQGPRLVFTSIDLAPDIYELPRHLLDFKASKTLGRNFSLSLTVRDILNSPIRRSYNFDEGFILDFDKFRYGTNYLLSVSYKL